MSSSGTPHPLPAGEQAPDPDAYPGVLGLLARGAWQRQVAMGVLTLALGALTLAWPGATVLVVGVLFGIYLLACGVVQLTVALQLAGAYPTHVPGHLRAVSFLSGVLSVLLGLICFRGAAQSILLLALWIGFGWLIHGFMTTAGVISAENLPTRGRQAVLGILTSLGGIVLIVSPFRSLADLTLVAGLWLVALGVLEIEHGLQVRTHLVN
ncbi:HdeD family acid-resistance protein [Streptomyces sp. NBC_01615]|uniref:HdeD family acid-resistance protein n=1 Tax=Streptomyces sp. NBC_01615 TaxID=2975898 RepID=UPI0038669A4E